MRGVGAVEIAQSNNVGTRGARVAEIGKRANELMRAGFYTADEVRWLAGYVRGDVDLIEVELLLTNAERMVAA